MRQCDLVLKFTVCLLVMGIAFSGCGIFGGGNKSRELILEGTPMLNSCGEDVANTLHIRIFQLSGDSQISISSLEGLWGDPEKELGEDFVNQLEMILEPGQRIPLSLTPAEGASVVAVVGNFCQTEGSCWKWVRPISKISSPQALTFDKFCIREAR